MKEPNLFTGKLLETSASAYAGHAASLLLERHPEVAERFEPGAFDAWKSHLTQRAVELAAAVSAGEPELFRARVGWARKAFRARKIAEEDLAVSLGCLMEVLRDKLPTGADQVVGEYLRPALSLLDEPAAPEEALLDSGTEEGQLALQYLLALLEGDTRRASKLVLDAVEAGARTRDIYLEVLLPVLREVGRMWHAAEVGVAEEHLATATTRRIMGLLCHREPPGKANGMTVVVAGVAGDAHDLAVQAVADFFEMAGWRSICLGADLPSADLVRAAQQFEAHAVVLSATLTSQLKSLEEAVRALRTIEGQELKILVGGQAFVEAPDLALRFGADAYADTVDGAVSAVSRLLGIEIPS